MNKSMGPTGILVWKFDYIGSLVPYIPQYIMNKTMAYSVFLVWKFDNIGLLEPLTPNI